jgi:putative aminopeptidase
MSTTIRATIVTSVFFLLARGGAGQSNLDLTQLSRIPAVSGHEEALSTGLLEFLKGLGPKTDNLGNVYVTLGSGGPHRLIVTPIDEPGYIVSGTTAEGYLRLQRLPQAPPNTVFDALHFAQPVWVLTRSGKRVSGVLAGLSVHLQPGRLNPPRMNHPEEMYVDIGAQNEGQVRAAGVDLLDPVVLSEGPDKLGSGFQVGRTSGDRFGATAIMRVLQKLSEQRPTLKPGTTTVAFVTQAWLGGRGLNRLLDEVHPDQTIYVGRIRGPAGEFEDQPEAIFEIGKGVLLGVPDPNAPLTEPARTLRDLAGKEKLALRVLAAQTPRIAGQKKTGEFLKDFAQLGLPTLWPATPAEVISQSDLDDLEQLLEEYLGASTTLPPVLGSGATTLGGEIGGISRETPLVQRLVVTYGASGHEGAVRERVKKLLQEWARKRITTDGAGNLVLHLGDGNKDAKTPRIAFVAHMDEIGYEVKKMEDDGRLQVAALGGGYSQYFLGHLVLVHKKDGGHVSGVLELPAGWDKPAFEWPTGPKAMDEPAHVYLGTKTKEETEMLGIAEGDFVTIPKQYRPLLGTRANARSFDDRVGCAAMIAAVNSIGPDLPGRDVTFVWSTEEEVGLKGAEVFAEQAAKEGRTPDFVFAIDTFVSSDSPLESKRFADAELGKGFVVRAADNSNIVPLQYLNRVVALAKENNIPVQYGVTGGGNDGSVFLRYGSVDVALGWPLRYSHSPAEVIDTKDLDALAKVVEVIGRKW